jgi:dTDP-glucose 4,6-dehydratase
MDERPKVVVITGGGGFLGSHLCDCMLAKGWRVIAIDNWITGLRANLSHLIDHPRFEFIQEDVIEGVHVHGRVDYVLHLASPASPLDYLRHPLPTIKASSLGTLNALELAREHDAVFLLASSSEVYGDPQVHPQTEDYWGNVDPVGDRSVYSEAKRFAEALSAAYGRCEGLSVRIARIFNGYGPRMRMDDSRIVPTFLDQALRGEPITVCGDGSQTRSMCFVSDIISGIVRLLLSDVREPVNLGNPEEITVSDFAHLVKGVTGSSSPIVTCPPRAGEPRVRCPSIERAKDLLGWSPSVPLREGLQRTVEWCERRLSETNPVELARLSVLFPEPGVEGEPATNRGMA